MRSFFPKAWDFVRHPTGGRTTAMLFILLLLVAIPLTVTLSQKQQEIRQRAAEVDCTPYENEMKLCDSENESKKAGCYDGEGSLTSNICLPAVEVDYKECTQLAKDKHPNCPLTPTPAPQSTSAPAAQTVVPPPAPPPTAPPSPAASTPPILTLAPTLAEQQGLYLNALLYAEDLSKLTAEYQKIPSDYPNKYYSDVTTEDANKTRLQLKSLYDQRFKDLTPSSTAAPAAKTCGLTKPAIAYVPPGGVPARLTLTWKVESTANRVWKQGKDVTDQSRITTANGVNSYVDNSMDTGVNIYNYIISPATITNLSSCSKEEKDNATNRIVTGFCYRTDTLNKNGTVTEDNTVCNAGGGGSTGNGNNNAVIIPPANVPAPAIPAAPRETPPTIAPSPKPQPVPTLVLNPMRLVFTNIKLQYIGKGPGDNASPSATARKLYLRKETSSNSKPEATGSMTYNAATSLFSGSVLVPANLPSGAYTISTDRYLRKSLGEITVTPEEQQTIAAGLTLLAGDINNDNKLDIGDYNILAACFDSKNSMSNLVSKFNSSACRAQSQRNNADINDDGKIDGVDFNEFISNMGNPQGDQ